MKTSENGLKFVAHWEGLRLERYKDSVGLDTIGVGHLITGKEVPEIGNTITVELALQLLSEDVLKAARCVNDQVSIASIILDQTEFDALVSFVFNVGVGAFQQSTLLRLLQQGLYKPAADQLLRWDKAAGKVIPGLSRRRAAERKLFLEDDYGDLSIT